MVIKDRRKVSMVGSNTLTNDKSLDWSKLKAFANDKINVTQNFLFGKGRKHCGKRRKCWLQAFSPFPQCSQNVFFFSKFVKSRDCVEKV